MPTLYVTEPGARIEKEYHRLLVVKEDTVLMEVPFAQVSEVVLIGAVGATTPALLSLLDAGCGLTLVNRAGKLRGRLIPAEARNLPLRRAQYLRSGDVQFCLQISRRMVEAKLKNQRCMMRRFLRSRNVGQNNELQRVGVESILLTKKALDKLPLAKNLAELRGVEGAASRAYFAVLRRILRPEFDFEKRSRRPPEDPANALLSFSYSLLTNAMYTACLVAGLDPYDGFYHADAYGRPALALDLVEEFRSVVADSVVIGLINKRIIKKTDFERSSARKEEGVYLSRRGMRKFLEYFTRRLNSVVFHPTAGRKLGYQKIFEVQARSLRLAIEQGSAEAYSPFLAK